MGRDSFHQTKFLKPPSTMVLNTAREGVATASLDNLGQCLTILTVKNFFLLSNLNLSSFSFKPLPLVLSLQAIVRSPSPTLSQTPSGTGSCSKVSPQPSLLQAEQPQLSQPFLTAEGFHPSGYCCGLLSTCSSRSVSCLCWVRQNRKCSRIV